MAEILSVNVFRNDLHIDPFLRQRHILSVEKKNDGSYWFSNWYTEVPNEFHLYHERFPENAFHTVVEIFQELESGTYYSDKSSFIEPWTFHVVYADGSEKNKTHSIGSDFIEVIIPLKKYIDFNEFMGNRYSTPPEGLPGICWLQCRGISDLTISVVREMCRKKEVSLYTLYDMILMDIYDDDDCWYYAALEVTDEGSQVFDQWYDGLTHGTALILDGDGYITDAAGIPLMTVLQKNSVRVIHRFSKGLYDLSMVPRFDW